MLRHERLRACKTRKSVQNATFLAFCASGGSVEHAAGVPLSPDTRLITKSNCAPAIHAQCFITSSYGRAKPEKWLFCHIDPLSEPPSGLEPNWPAVGGGPAGPIAEGIGKPRDGLLRLEVRRQDVDLGAGCRCACAPFSRFKASGRRCTSARHIPALVVHVRSAAP